MTRIREEEEDWSVTKRRLHPQSVAVIKINLLLTGLAEVFVSVAPLRPKTQRRLEDRELNEARSKQLGR